jgi:hypothetical protein
MDGTKRGRKPPLEVRREFTTGRLEVQVLTQTYELIVPVIRKPVSTGRTLWDLIEGEAVEAPSRRMVQGA